jgi:hypothetical protein
MSRFLVCQKTTFDELMLSLFSKLGFLCVISLVLTYAASKYINLSMGSSFSLLTPQK